MMRHEDIEIRSLGGTSFDEIARAFMEAFADYGIDFDAAKIRDMFVRRGARPDLSFAAFSGDRIVSFIINGIGRYGGTTAAYDTGTGTVPDFRGRRLTGAIFEYSQGRLAEAGIGTYVLEVLCDNTPAVKIYRGQGFEETRVLDCYAGDASAVLAHMDSQGAAGITLREDSVAGIANLAGFMDFEPSWQNAPESLMRNPGAFDCLVAYEGCVPVGFGVSETAYGDISLLAVDRSRRRRGIGSALLRELARRSRPGTVKVLNIDTGCQNMKAFMAASGLDFTCSQYEMRKRLT